jgi:3-dehydroshikimate dehydratase
VIRLSAFADEISADPREQVAVLQDTGIHSVDLRGAWGTNVLDLTPVQIDELTDIFGSAAVRVAAIASPIGKSPIDAPAEVELRRLRHAIDLAHHFDAEFIRIFSFYGPDGGSPTWRDAWHDEVIDRLRLMASEAAAGDVRLVHENERDIYGDTVERCVDLLTAVRSPAFAAAFDPANFIQCGQTPLPDAYDALRPFIAYVHVKDAMADGTVVPAGSGVARFPDLLRRLRDDGYNGTFALEPHLAAHGRRSGFSGPDLFATAVHAFRQLLDDGEYPYE